MNERQMHVTKSDKHDTSSSSRTYITHAVDVDIRLVNDQVPFAEVDSNNTPDSTNMCHRGGEIDQDAEQYQAKSPLLKVKLGKSKEMIEKETYNELSRRFFKQLKVQFSIANLDESAFLTQRPVSNIPIVFNLSDSIRPEGFLSSVLLWLVINIAVVSVSVTVVVVVESSSVVKLSFSLRFRGGNIPFNTSRQSPDENFHHFLIIWHHSGTQGWAKESHHDRASSVKVPVANFTLQSSFIGWSTGTLCSYTVLLLYGASLGMVILSLYLHVSGLVLPELGDVQTTNRTSFLMGSLSHVAEWHEGLLGWSGLRTASAAAKPCQGDSSEVYLITGRIPTVAAAGQRHVNSQPHAHTSYF
ncbi:hypothetical protein Tco_0241604 [Tanacetum coccineum]